VSALREAGRIFGPPAEACGNGDEAAGDPDWEAKTGSRTHWPALQGCPPNSGQTII